MNKQKGFTLIELVVVLVILGLLAALAIPRFVSLQTEARIAVIDSLNGSLKSMSTIVYAKSIAVGVNNQQNATITIDTGNLNVNYGYPTALQSNLSVLFDDISPRYSFSAGGNTPGSSLIIGIDGVSDAKSFILHLLHKEHPQL